MLYILSVVVPPCTFLMYPVICLGIDNVEQRLVFAIRVRNYADFSETIDWG